ncbi:MAG: hypothetical protein HWN65_15920 [Candidatus Helarchaeota archaeon]|nr:hypothetical protein [Candidatus Helarchaeota archaeon]
MQDYIIIKSKERNLSIPEINNKIDYKELDIYSSNNLNELKKLQEIAVQRGGKCRSTEYINNRTKVELVCKEGHVWEATPDSIKQGKWCKKCTGLSLKKMQEIAKQRGGKCISPEYVNNYTKLEFQCKEGHIWESIPSNIKRGTWCPKCGAKGGGRKRRLRKQLNH